MYKAISHYDASYHKHSDQVYAVDGYIECLEMIFRTRVQRYIFSHKYDSTKIQ